MTLRLPRIVLPDKLVSRGTFVRLLQLRFVNRRVNEDLQANRQLLDELPDIRILVCLGRTRKYTLDGGRVQPMGVTH